jgi:L-ascorbate metabolism protein UlaG (beta-lactamase superfamily)
MKNLIYFLSVFFIINGVLFPQVDSQKELQITYIANEGFLISCNNTKILIDGLFNTKHYTSPSDSLISLLMENKNPVDNIGYLLVTHDHQDHFNEKLISEFMSKSPEVKFISTPESCNKLIETGLKSSNIISQNLEIGELKKIDKIKDENCSVTALRLMHGTSTEIDNLAFIINLNGFNIMHMGDAFILQSSENIEKINWDDFKIDVLFVGYMDVNQYVLEILSKTIKPKNLIMMHIHKDDIQEAKDRNKQYSGNAVIFEKELETKTFSK